MQVKADTILWPSKPRRGFLFWRRSLIVQPYQIGIVIRDGEVVDVFSEGARRLPKGEVRTYVASTAPFSPVFSLKDPDDQGEPDEGIALDQPALTADGQPVTGRIALTLSVNPDHAERLLQLLGPRGRTITRPYVADVIKGELLAKVLALDIHKHTSGELRGNEALLRGMYASLETELTSTISRYGLRLDNFYVNWDLTHDERERIKEQRHEDELREIEREREREEARNRKKQAPPERPQPSPPWPEPARNPPPPAPPAPTVRSGRSYMVYTDKPTKRTTIHDESCRFYRNRKATRRSDNWWHGPYASKEQARSSSKNAGALHECGVCRP